MPHLPEDPQASAAAPSEAAGPTPEALDDGSGRLQLALEAAGLGVYDCDIAAGALHLDARARRLCGVGPDEPATPEALLHRLYAEDRAAVQEAASRALDPAGDGRFSAECRVVGPEDGMVRWVAAEGTTVFRGGRAVRVVGTVQDMTARRQREEALRASEARLAATLRSMVDEVWIVDADGQVVLVNPAVERHLGVAPGHWPDFHAALAELEVYRPDGTPRPPEEAPLARALDGVVTEAEREIVRNLATGELRWREVASGPIHDAGGRVAAAVVVVRDITEEVRASESLQESEQRLRSVLENLSEGLMLFDAEMNLVYQNPASLRIHGFRDDEPARLTSDVVPVTWLAWDEEERPVPFEEWPVSRVFRGERFQGQVLRVLRPDTGYWFTGSYNGCPLSVVDGKVRSGFITIREITREREAQVRLRESEARYRELFTNLTEEVHFWQVVRGPGGRIETWRLVDANPPALATWGRRSIDEVRGKAVDEIFGPGATEHFRPVVERIMAEGAPHSFEDYSAHLDRYFRFTSVPLGEYFITTGADITTIKSLNMRLQRAMAETHHRLKNNLQTVVALLEMASTVHGESVPGEEVRRLSQHVRGLATIHDLLTTQAKDSGAADRLSARDTIGRLLPVLQSSLSGRSVQADLADVPVAVRKVTALALVVNELVANAIKHADRGDIQVRFRAQEQTGILTVEDDGPGVGPGFAPESAANMGLELVLMLCRWDLGGRIAFEDRPEGGVRVTVQFPLEA